MLRGLQNEIDNDHNQWYQNAADWASIVGDIALQPRVARS